MWRFVLVATDTGVRGVNQRRHSSSLGHTLLWENSAAGLRNRATAITINNPPIVSPIAFRTRRTIGTIGSAVRRWKVVLPQISQVRPRWSEGRLGQHGYHGQVSVFPSLLHIFTHSFSPLRSHFHFLDLMSLS